jgi:CRP-like cAMP-binding protein
MNGSAQDARRQVMMFRRTVDNKADVLRKVPLFANLSKRDLLHIERITEEIESEPGDVLIRQGELGRELMVMVDGSARVEQNGREIDRLISGDVFGEMSLLDGKPRSATVITETPSTLLIVHKQSFDDLLDTVPGLSRQLLLALCERIRRRDATPT